LKIIEIFGGNILERPDEAGYKNKTAHLCGSKAKKN
jgi:hypothetical protein